MSEINTDVTQWLPSKEHGLISVGDYKIPSKDINVLPLARGGGAVAQWLGCCATNWKVAGSIPASVSRFFIDINSFRSHYDPGVDSACNRNEYQEYFMVVKAAGA